MKVSRKKTRRFLFQKIYTRTFWDFNENLYKEYFFDKVFDYNMDKKYLDEMFLLIIKNEDYLINIIKRYAPRFDIQSMNFSIIIPIFISLTEMLFLKEEIPAKVSINEAIELSKTFWDESSKKIVNGILNNFLKEIENYKEKDKELLKSDFHFFS